MADRLTISRASQAKYYGVVFLLAFIIYFPGTNRPLRDAEAKYAEIPREMLVLGDWLTPHLDYASYYDKPPLTFWTTALLYKAFGVSERAARLANIFWAFLAAFLTGILAERMFGGGHGYLASGGGGVLPLGSASATDGCLSGENDTQKSNRSRQDYFAFGLGGDSPVTLLSLPQQG